MDREAHNPLPGTLSDRASSLHQTTRLQEVQVGTRVTDTKKEDAASRLQTQAGLQGKFPRPPQIQGQGRKGTGAKGRLRIQLQCQQFES